MDQNRKYFYRILFLLVLFTIAFFFVYKVTHSQASIHIRGDKFNPITTRVYVGKQRLYPSGKEGRTYVYTGMMGTKIATVTEPHIKTAEIKLNVKLWSKQSADLTPTSRSSEEITSGVLKSRTGTAITSTRFFGDRNWLVVTTTYANEQQQIYVLSYDFNERSWKIRGSGIALNYNDFLDAPQPLYEYLNELIEGGHDE